MAIVGGSAGLKVHSQVTSRHPANFTDLHGRKYFATVENKTGHPVGVIQPVNGWRAPMGMQEQDRWAKGKLNPPSEFLKIKETDGGTRLVIDYDGWLRAWDDADRDRTETLHASISAEGQKQGLSLSQISDQIKNPPSEYLKLVGDGPGVMWPRAFIVAMARGNKYVLGLSPDIPQWAVPLLATWRKQQGNRIRRPLLDDETEYPDADIEAAGLAEFGAGVVSVEVVGTPEEKPITQAKKSHKKQPPRVAVPA